MWKLQGSIKKVEFPVVIKIKWISIWVLIFVLGLSKQPSPRGMSHHNLAEFSRSETLFSLEFLSVKWQIWKFQWLFQKIRYRVIKWGDIDLNSSGVTLNSHTYLSMEMYWIVSNNHVTRCLCFRLLTEGFCSPTPKFMKCSHNLWPFFA